MEFTPTARGAPALILKYLVNQKNASGKISLRCAVNRSCGGSVTTEDGVVTERKSAHITSQLSTNSDLVTILKIKRFGYVGKVRLIHLVGKMRVGEMRCRRSEKNPLVSP